MESSPLHPALVHLPLGIAIVMPFVTGFVFYLIRSEMLPQRGWWVVLVLQLFLVAGGAAALQTGEGAEEAVEKNVTEEVIEAHEEAAKIFMGISVLTLIVIGAGLMDSSFRSTLQGFSVVLLLGALGAGMFAGKKGGEIVYKHKGVCDCNVLPGGGAAAGAGERDRHEEKDD